MRIVYADVLFLLNAAADLVCLLAAGEVLDRRPKLWRIAAAAAFGGGYAVCCVLPGLEVLQHPFFILLVGCALVVISFGLRHFLRSLLCFLASSAVVGGVLFAVWQLTGAPSLFSQQKTGRVFLIAFALSWALGSSAFRRLGRERRGGGIVDVQAVWRGRKAAFRALVDTGNSLRDPVSGSRVLVCEADVLEPLFPPQIRVSLRTSTSPAALLEASQNCEERIPFRLIPFQTAIGSGMLPAFRPEKMIINGKEVSTPLIAVTRETLSDGGIYSALAYAEEE